MNTINPYRQFSEVLLLASLWGPAFLWTSIALQDISPITLVSCRIGIGSLILLLILSLRNISLRCVSPTLWGHSFVLGFFNNGFPFLCFAEAVRHIPISLAGLINGSTPIFTILLANIFLADERLSRHRIIGLLLGLSGFLLIVFPQFLSQNETTYSLYGVAMGFAGAASYAVGIIYAKRFATQAPPLVMPTLQLLSSLVYLIPLALLLEEVNALWTASSKTWLSLSLLACFSTSLAFMMFYRIVKTYGATPLAMVTYLLPIFGTLLGFFFLNEQMNLIFWLAAGLILGGVFVVNRQPKHIPPLIPSDVP